jgi:hypothetical protein
LRRILCHILAGLIVLFATGLFDPAGAVRRRESDEIDIVVPRPARAPLMAIVSLGHQRVTIYDAEGSILRARISSGRAGYETPAGIYSVLQKEEVHSSNLYDDAEMPFMQRLTWSGIALHAGPLPGYPASHGCIRMPYEFAEQLYDLTSVGMRVIVSRNDVAPVDIAHPALFESAVPLPRLKALAAAKTAEAREAARKAHAAKLAAARFSAEAARLVPAAEGMKRRAEAELVAAESLLANSGSPRAVELAEAALARARARLADAEAQLVTAGMQAPLKAEAAARASEEASAAEAETLAASEASRDATRRMAPISIFISRKTERLYIRQAFREVLESPVTIKDPAEPLGTHIYSALETKGEGTALRWNVVSLRSASDQARRGVDDSTSLVVGETNPARAALDRLEIPRETRDRIAEMISPGSSLIVSDEAMSAETGKETDFVILLSGEPQGGIKKRSPVRQARERDAIAYERPSRRSPASPPPFYWGDPYGRW